MPYSDQCGACPEGIVSKPEGRMQMASLGPKHLRRPIATGKRLDHRRGGQERHAYFQSRGGGH